MYKTGAILILLLFVHIIGDLAAQTDSMARRKTDESPWLLVVHSVVYALMFLPVLSVIFSSVVHLTLSCVLALAMSHGAIDTYAPIWLWARFVRKPDDMREDAVNGFTSWTSRPYGMTIAYGMDQLLHICFLIPIAVMIAVHDESMGLAKAIGFITLWVSIGLASVSVVTVLFFWGRKPLKTSVSPQPDDDDGYERTDMPSQHD